MARPSKLTPEIQKKIIEAVKAGNYYEAACAYAGVSYSTLRGWIVKGEKAKSGKYLKFLEAVRQAEAEAEARIVLQWQKAMPEDWRAAQAFLERRYPERWGKKETHVVEGGDQKKPIKLQVEGNIDELLDQYERIVKRIQQDTVGDFQEDSSPE